MVVLFRPGCIEPSLLCRMISGLAVLWCIMAGMLFEWGMAGVVKCCSFHFWLSCVGMSLV